MRQLYLLTFLLFTTAPLYAQSSLTGTIKDEDGLSLTGATILLKGTSQFVVADASGNFSLPSSSELPVTLVVDLIGYKKQEIEIYELPEEPLEVILKNDNLLNEVVVIGYGTQTRGDLTGSIASIQSDLLKQPISSVDKALQGAATGVQVTPTSGQPGGGVSIRIRGGSSITGGNEPLYVIDGYPIVNSSSGTGTITGAEVNPLSTINPADIESIDVLKDASATSIYGSRAANGVIIITTKKGKAEKNIITYDGSFGVQSLRKKIDVLNAKQFAVLRNEALFDTNPAKGPNQYLSQEQIDNLGEGTDWQDEAFREASVQNHQLSFSGGTNKTRYYIGGSYFLQDGIIRNTDFKRYSGRVNLDINPTEKLTVGLNLTATKSEASVAPNGIVTALLSMPATATIYDANGGYTLRNPFENIFSNPIASLNEQVNNNETKRLFTTVFGEYSLLKDLKVKVSFGADLIDTRENRYVPSNIYEGSTTKGEAGIGFLESSSWLNENTLTYDKTFGKHSFNVLAGFTQQEFKREIVRTGAQRFVSDEFGYNSLQSASSVLTPFSNYRSTALLSYLGRVNYNFSDRYFVTASLRADGSSVFGTNNKWGYFPSVGLSWKVANEKFFESVPSVLNDLKVRVSYGETGNNDIEPYLSLATLNSVSYLIDGKIVNGFTPSRLPNPNLGWESSYQFDGGIDLGLFNNRVLLSFDAYHKKTSGLLLNVELPWTSGYSTSLQNYGSVLNRGLEISLKSTNIEGKLTWTSGVNFSLNRNEVTSLGNGLQSIITGNYIVKVGEPLGTYYATVTDGILQVGEEGSRGAYTGSATPKPGDRLYKDVSGDGKFTTALDRAIVGNAQPKFIFGLTNTIEWNSFDLTFLFQGSYGNKILNANAQALELFNGQQNASASALNRYSSTNTNTTIPRAKLDPAPVFSDRFIEDGSFIRLRNITLSYTLPGSIVSKIKTSNVKVFVTAQNLFTWTRYTGFDPEVTSGNNTTQQGTDLGIYPVARTISGGLSLSF
jgi:TonB-dependent starch-binding outer membrane protein SusC